MIGYRECLTFVMNKFNISIVEHIRVENLSFSVSLTVPLNIFYDLPILKIFKFKIKKNISHGSKTINRALDLCIFNHTRIKIS